MDKQINKMGNSFKKIEEKFGEDFLYDTLQEIIGQTGIEFIKRFNALQSEIYFALLLNKFPGKCSLKKMKYNKKHSNKKVDILFRYNKDEWYIEVKRVFDEDCNLFWIEEVLYGSLFLKRNEILREFNNVSLKGERIDDYFRNKIIEFIHNETLTISLQNVKICKEKSFEDISLKMTKFYIEKGIPESYLEIIMNGCNNIKITFILDRTEEREKKRFTIEMKENKEFPKYYSIRCNNTYWEGETYLNIVKLCDKLSQKCKKIKEKFNGINKKKKKAGLIHLDIHPKNEGSFIKAKQEIKNTIEREIPDIPCIIFPYVTLSPSIFGRLAPILNKAAENSIFNQLVKNSN